MNKYLALAIDIAGLVFTLVVVSKLADLVGDSDSGKTFGLVLSASVYCLHCLHSTRYTK